MKSSDDATCLSKASTYCLETYLLKLVHSNSRGQNLTASSLLRRYGTQPLRRCIGNMASRDRILSHGILSFQVDNYQISYLSPSTPAASVYILALFAISPSKTISSEIVIRCTCRILGACSIHEAALYSSPCIQLQCKVQETEQEMMLIGSVRVLIMKLCQDGSGYNSGCQNSVRTGPRPLKPHLKVLTS